MTALTANDDVAIVGVWNGVGIKPCGIAETVMLLLCLGGLKDELLSSGESKELISMSSDCRNKCEAMKQRGKH